MRFIRNNVIAVIALVLAMTGTGIAASRYVITSTKQVKPSVLRKLRGPRGRPGPSGADGREGPQGKEGPVGKIGATGAQGATGKDGPTGPTGTEGSAGKEGPPGPLPATLPSGKTLTGVYDAEGVDSSKTVASFAGGSISFQFPLATAPQNQFLAPGETTGECPGSVSAPAAASGWLCVYEAESKDAAIVSLGPPSEPFARFGTFVSVESTKAEGGFFSTGSWAVTGD